VPRDLEVLQPDRAPVPQDVVSAAEQHELAHASLESARHADACTSSRDLRPDQQRPGRHDARRRAAVEDCRKLAADLGWPVGDEYNDMSAYTSRRRPEYERLLSDLADGSRDAVLI
jgi:hypothetical protein